MIAKLLTALAKRVIMYDDLVQKLINSFII